MKKFIRGRKWNYSSDNLKAVSLDYSKTDFSEWFVNDVQNSINLYPADGIMLDWWHDGHYHSNGFSKNKIRKQRHLISASLRKHFGEDFIIMGNVNYGDNTDVKNLNGAHMELWKTNSKSLHSNNEILKTERALIRFQKELRPPKIVAMLGKRQTLVEMGSLRHSPQINKDRNSKANRRMAKLLLAMTVSIVDNGYFMYGDNNEDTSDGDHAHIIYDFYSFDIGKPTGGYEKLANGVELNSTKKVLLPITATPDLINLS